MVQGLFAFGLAALLAVVAYFVIVWRRRGYEESDPASPPLTDEEFRRIEFGDDEP